MKEFSLKHQPKPTPPKKEAGPKDELSKREIEARTLHRKDSPLLRLIEALKKREQK